MRAFTFNKSLSNKMNIYIYSSERGKLFEKNWNGFSNLSTTNKITFSELSNKESENLENLHFFRSATQESKVKDSPSIKHVINNVNREEVAVYLAFIWKISAGLIKFGIPCYYRDIAKKLLKKSFVGIKWEYLVDTEDLIKKYRF